VENQVSVVWLHKWLFLCNLSLLDCIAIAEEQSKLFCRLFPFKHFPATECYIYNSRSKDSKMSLKDEAWFDCREKVLQKEPIDGYSYIGFLLHSICLALYLTRVWSMLDGQALCSSVGQQPGRRTANGVDGQRLSLLLAVSLQFIELNIYSSCFQMCCHFFCVPLVGESFFIS